MKALVTGSAGHLGEALVRSLRDQGVETVGVDIQASPFTDVVGSVADKRIVESCMHGVRQVFHTATLHKPHVVTHNKQDFVETNISGTLSLLEAAVKESVSAFVFTSTTSVYGNALRPPVGTPAAWITEEVVPQPRNIYGITKLAAENLCQLFHRQFDLNVITLRTSRFFPEEDDDRGKRERFSDQNIKAMEYLYRRVELADVVNAHLKAAEKAPALVYSPYIISATTPFLPTDLPILNTNAPAVIQQRVPQLEAQFNALGWQLFPVIERVYVNAAAQRDLDWTPHYDIGEMMANISQGKLPRSPVSRQIGSRGYHDQVFSDGPFPVED